MRMVKSVFGARVRLAQFLVLALGQEPHSWLEELSQQLLQVVSLLLFLEQLLSAVLRAHPTPNNSPNGTKKMRAGHKGKRAIAVFCLGAIGYCCDWRVGFMPAVRKTPETALILCHSLLRLSPSRGFIGIGPVTLQFQTKF